MKLSANIITQLLAIGAFIMSGVSLYFSRCKDKFEREVATAEQISLMLSKMGEMRLQILKYQDLLAQIRSLYIQNSDSRLEIVVRYERLMELLGSGLEEQIAAVPRETRMSYRDIKLRQSHYDAMNSMLEFIIRGTDELMKTAK